MMLPSIYIGSPNEISYIVSKSLSRMWMDFHLVSLSMNEGRRAHISNGLNINASPNTIINIKLRL
jgi:hypothetical protein